MDINIDHERRIAKLEGTVAWMRWVWIAVGGAIIASAVGLVFSSL